MLTLGGFIVGFLIGMTGMGGGAFMTPYLILVIKFNPVMAIGTDLVFASITKIGGGIQHFRQHTAHLKAVFWLALGSLPASRLSASYVLSNVDNQESMFVELPAMLGIVLLLVGGLTAARSLGWLGEVNKDPVDKWPPPLAWMALGAFGGLLVGLTSVGAGSVIIALVLIFFSVPAADLVGLDVTHGAVLAVFAAANYVVAGQVDWTSVGWLVLGSLPGAWLGARAVVHVPQRMVRGIMGGLLLLVGSTLLRK